MNDLFNALGLKPAYLLAGLAGGFVRAIVHPERNIWTLLSTAVIGALTAVYLTPVAVGWFPWASDQGAENAAAFAIGVSAQNVAMALIDVVKKRAGGKP